MVCLGFRTWGAELKAQTNPLSYGGTPTTVIVICAYLINSQQL